ncbi:hypothetical protein SUGI_0801820 [Cryptomeria japonica]|uniref:uncharacterized protein LOC131038410 n=1 Tax=Cryptomeria japonica TaxID=3369 RepID=UPI002414C4F4|nr:uncharacterized protein LOC131038410 [Cryptomeria japonica]GLJ39291.1 hypothetical protein SUGI_0801820 [Cryptomeria japonica]
MAPKGPKASTTGKADGVKGENGGSGEVKAFPKQKKAKTVMFKPTKETVVKAIKSEKKKKKKRGVESYKRFIYKVLKQVHPSKGISSAAMDIMESFMIDIFEKITCEAASLLKYNKIMTLFSREVESAVKFVLPGELAKHAVSEGSKAVTKFSTHLV